MRLSTRKLMDRAFSATGFFAIALMLGALGIILVPMFKRGAGAYVFRGTIEHRKVEMQLFDRGDLEALRKDMALAEAARQPVYDRLHDFRSHQKERLDQAIDAAERLGARDDNLGRRIRRSVQRLREMQDFEQQINLLIRLEDVTRRQNDPALTDDLDLIAGVISDLEDQTTLYGELVHHLRELFGPLPGDGRQIMPRDRFGQTRWDRTQVKLQQLLFIESWDHSDPSRMGEAFYKPRKERYLDTPLYPVFEEIETNIDAMMRPRLTFYWRFLTDVSHDANIFGGIGPAALGTLYLTLGAILFAVPLGILAAIYFTEYAKPGRIISLLRTCVSTLAGVPSIVFGLFGLAFFIHTIRVSPSKSVLAGSLTLGLLILPTIIRASEEAILAVPQAYKEAAMSLGAGRWRTVLTVILPAALPGILTGTVISMGRAAGETAPIIFTAAVSIGMGLRPWEVFDNPTPALSWNIYNLATEHEAVDEIRHVQYGMVTTLVGIVLLLNVFAISLRARISKKLRG